MTAAIIIGVYKRSLTLTRAFSLDYRLSSTTAPNPFPAPIIDAISAYSYLVHTMGFLPENIIVAGDSAGGNLALSFIRYLVDHSSSPDFSLPVPGALFLSSPWADLSDSYFHLVPPHARHADYLVLPTPTVEGWLPHAARIYGGKVSKTELAQNPYLSPASRRISTDKAAGMFKGFPTTFISVGGAEVFRTAIETLRERMVEDLGEEKFVFDEVPDAVHCFPAFSWCEPESGQALERAARWVDSLGE